MERGSFFLGKEQKNKHAFLCYNCSNDKQNKSEGNSNEKEIDNNGFNYWCTVFFSIMF